MHPTFEPTREEPFNFVRVWRLHKVVLPVRERQSGGLSGLIRKFKATGEHALAGDGNPFPWVLFDQALVVRRKIIELSERIRFVDPFTQDRLEVTPFRCPIRRLRRR